MLCVQPCTHPCHLCQQCSSSSCPHTPPMGHGVWAALCVSQLPSLNPKGGKKASQPCPFTALPPRFASSGREETAVLAKDAVQDETTRGAAHSRTQSNRCKAGTKSGGSHYFGLGHFQSLAVSRVTQRLARSPVALHIPFLSMNEWSNLAGGHCKAQ